MSSEPREREDVHHIQVVFLPTGFGREPPPVRSILVDRTSTFDEIIKVLREGDWDRWTVFQAHYGHEPGWTVCESTAMIEATCQILYAVDNTSGLDCVLALIRTSSYDYPLPIYDSTSAGTIKQVLGAAYPSLMTDITSIIRYGSCEDISDTSFHLIKKAYNQFSMACIVTVGEPPARFRMNVDVESILPFLQVSFLNCENLVQRSFYLPRHSCQMVYASSALSHAIVCLSSEMKTARRQLRSITIGRDGKMQEPSSVINDEGPNDSLLEDLVGDRLSVRDRLLIGDRLRFNHLLAQELEKLLEEMLAIMEKITGGIAEADLGDDIRRELDTIYLKLCGEYSKVVTIRRGYLHFCTLGRLDEEQIQESIATGKAADSHTINKEEPVHMTEKADQQDTSATPVDADAFAVDSSSSGHLPSRTSDS